MAKRLISACLALTVFLFSSISIFADTTSQGDYFLRNITVNGENIVNYRLTDPVLLYKWYTYIPMNSEMGSIMGFKAEVDSASRTLKITKTAPSRTTNKYDSVKNNLDNVSVTVSNNYNVVAITDQATADKVYASQTPAVSSGATDNSTSVQDTDKTVAEKANDQLASGDSETIAANVVSTSAEKSYSVADKVAAQVERGKLLESVGSAGGLAGSAAGDKAVVELDLKGMPVLIRNSTLYVPINTLIDKGALGYSYYYDDYAGIYISTNASKDASSYFKKADRNYYYKLAAYINGKNKSVSMAEAFQMVKYFEAYGNMKGVDPLILMAVAEGESTFRAGIVNRYGCCGLMQIKASTGNAFGFSKSQLLTAKGNINMGATYIAYELKLFGGNITKALAAYNAGEGNVKRGNYSTSYANKVISRANNIRAYAK